MRFSDSGNAIAASCRTTAVGEHGRVAMDRWKLRAIPEALLDRYIAEGWWTDAGLGDMVAEGLDAMRAAAFEVHSKVHPWSGTFGDVDRAARALARSLRE